MTEAATARDLNVSQSIAEAIGIDMERDDRILVLPHIGGATHDVVRRHSEMIREDLERLLRGERPLRCANPEVLDAVLPLR